MRVLVAYGSKMGGTAGLAEMIGASLRDRDVEADVMPATAVKSLDRYDAAIVGGALYAGRWHRDARRFLRQRRTTLRTMPLWLFSSGPLGDDAQDPDIPPVRQVASLARDLGARGHRTFGGRLLPDSPGFMARAMASKLAGDWRAPDQVDCWASEIASTLAASHA
jgi:menaquinone-dependent protoporphyrinogen oxidase